MKITARKKFRILRILQDKSQEKLAAEVGCDRSLISLIETGRILPSGKFRKRFCEALRVDDPDELFGPEIDKEA